MGSRAHRLEKENSDYDFRSVYVDCTSDMFKLFHKHKPTSWIEGDIDNTSYEVGHFLELASKCNPSVLEIFKAPIVEDCDTLLEGVQMRDLFSAIWNPEDAFNSYTGYGYNQRTKMLQDKDRRTEKYAVAYLRTLFNLKELLTTGDFTIEVGNLEIGEKLRHWRDGKFSKGEVIDTCNTLVEECRRLKEGCQQKPNIDKVNEWLIDVRSRYW